MNSDKYETLDPENWEESRSGRSCGTVENARAC